MNNFMPYTPDDTSMDYHQLLDSFLPHGESDPGPTIRAAGDEGPFSLVGHLAEIFRPIQEGSL